MGYTFLTLDDVNVSGRSVLVRVDINSPISPRNGKILDISRMRAIQDTLNDLKPARVVLLAHQSRPGKSDFTTLRPHAKVLRTLTGGRVRFVEDIFGPTARDAIKSTNIGEILLLENVRFYSEENIEVPPENLVKTHLVRILSPYFDLFVNDAFPAAHRSHPSLVGFAEVLPTVAGRVMERELNALNKSLNPDRPCAFVIGGSKVYTKLKIIENILKNGKADKILVGGLLTHIFLQAVGRDIGKVNEKAVAEYGKLLDHAKKLIKKHESVIEIPTDVGIDKDDERINISTDELPSDHQILDVGPNTVDKYIDIINASQTVVANGPLGVFERNDFAFGTKKIVEAMATHNETTIVGGGELGALIYTLGLDSKLSHVSTGGGATISLLSGEQLPVIAALERASKRFRQATRKKLKKT
ncbi:MAG: phosphoglycerate kinase [Promethearchaeota archaeon]